MTTLATVIGKGAIGSRPAAASAGRLYFSTEPKTYRDNGSSWDDVSDAGSTPSGSITASGYTQTTARLLGRTTGATGAIEEISVGTGLSLSAGSLTATGGSASDPIADNFGTPDTAFEFNANDFTGLTSLSTTPDVAAMDTTIPGHLLLSDNDGEWVGYYASVSAPFTAIVKLDDGLFGVTYQHVGMFCSVATPGKMMIVDLNYNGSLLPAIGRYTGPTDSSGSGVSLHATPGFYALIPCYFAIKAVSSTDISYYWSRNGAVWYPLLVSDNNTMTVASVGVHVGGFVGATAAGSFDFLRIWNSAKTFVLLVP